MICCDTLILYYCENITQKPYAVTVQFQATVQHTVAMMNHESTMVYRQGGHMKVYRIEGTKAKEDQYNNRHIKVRINRRFESHFEYHRIESI